MTNRNSSILYRIYAGYAESVMGLLRLLMFIGAIAAVSFAFTFPLWYWALHGTASFTIFVLIVFAGALFYIAYTKAAGYVARRRKEGKSYLQILKFPLVRAGRLLLLLFFVYIVVSFFASGLIAPALISALIGLFVLGFLFFMG